MIMNYGERIKVIRKRGGFSQRELGEKLGFHQGTVSAWEKSAYPPLDAIEKVCRILKVPLYEFFLTDEERDELVPSGVDPVQVKILQEINRLPVKKRKTFHEMLIKIFELMN